MSKIAEIWRTIRSPRSRADPLQHLVLAHPQRLAERRVRALDDRELVLDQIAQPGVLRIHWPRRIRSRACARVATRRRRPAASPARLRRRVRARAAGDLRAELRSLPLDRAGQPVAGRQGAQPVRPAPVGNRGAPGGDGGRHRDAANLVRGDALGEVVEYVEETTAAVTCPPVSTRSGCARWRWTSTTPSSATRLEFRPPLVDGGAARCRRRGWSRSSPPAGCSRRPGRTRASSASRAPVICYQGALIADPATGEWLCHEPLEVPLARGGDPASSRPAGFHMNVYVDDRLYVEELNEEARPYATHARLEAHPVGDLGAGCEQPTTKIVVVGDPAALDGLEAAMRGDVRRPAVHRQVAARTSWRSPARASPRAAACTSSATTWGSIPPTRSSLRRRRQRRRAAPRRGPRRGGRRRRSGPGRASPDWTVPGAEQDGVAGLPGGDGSSARCSTPG